MLQVEASPGYSVAHAKEIEAPVGCPSLMMSDRLCRYKDCHFQALADKMLVLSRVVARWILMYTKCAMGSRATALSDVYILIVDALSKRDPACGV